MKTLVSWFYLCAFVVLALANKQHRHKHELKERQFVGPIGPLLPHLPRCYWTCPPQHNPQHTLEITNKAKEKLLSIYSEFTKIALVKDYANNIAAIFNGSSGEVAVSDFKNKCHYHIEHTNVYGWTASASSWAAHFAKLTSLLPLLQEAKKANIVECAYDEHTPVFQAIARGYIALGSFLPPNETHQMLIELAEHLQGPYGVVYKNSSRFSIQNNLEWFLKVNLALAQLLQNGKVSPTIQKATFDLKLIFGSNSGFEGLLNFFIHIAPHCDVFRLILPSMSNEERMFRLLLRLSGGSDKGIDGLLNIIIKIVMFMHGHGDINDIITTIINYTPDGADTRLSALIDKFLKFIAAQQRYHNLPPQLQMFIHFLKALNENNLVMNGVNVSDIIKLLRFYNPSDTIPTILKILSLFSPSRGIPQFIRFITAVLNGTHNANILTRLIPGLNLAQFNGSGNILQQILHGQNLTALLNGGVAGLSQIPIFGNVIKSIQSAFPGVNISQYLNPISIFHQIQNTFGHGLEGFFAGLEHGIESILGGGSNSSGGLLSGISHLFGDGGGESSVVHESSSVASISGGGGIRGGGGGGGSSDNAVGGGGGGGGGGGFSF